MFHCQFSRIQGAFFLVLLVGICFAPQSSAGADKKKPAAVAKPQAGPTKYAFDPKKLAWPSPPYFPRIHWLDYFAGEKIDYSKLNAKPPKASWMDRLAGGESTGERTTSQKLPYQFLSPYGLAVDSKSSLYVADTKVGAIFIFNTETHDATLIRNGHEARFGLLNCIAIDDDDRLFASDGDLHHVLVFNPNHVVEGSITEGLVDPVGLAIDTSNRFLYVVDTKLDQVFVYDADTFKLLRKLGTGGKNHALTSPGDFSLPTGVAVDNDGNVYVTDTLNNRVEIFDADGGLIRVFGKNGDGPGYFARPKGIAVDADGHIWVADQMNDRLQVFNKEGQLLTYIGNAHGSLPGQFSSLINVAVDKKNRVFTAEQLPGRVQMLQYVSDAEAEAGKAKWEEEQGRLAEERRRKSGAKPAGAEDTKPAPPADNPAPKPSGL